ncbi:breast cancer anti-estrogen resistance protein 1 [Clonorchis sinensis]|uniref:Breast cancer anti-estrogen resistance protein 1 n=1 Tax=Clonorchis sinensis TaxID=79923 RepID=H2KPD0_CLOSI|nr:breast cancer anti-estrogen resistance protein 1 [Clonorchis sinensis]
MSTQQKRITKPLPILLARALYDNKAEFPAELSFCRGDVVTVLQRNPEGYIGWWICSYKGKLGIAPGNRFEVLGVVHRKNQDSENDVYDDPTEWLSTNVNKTATSSETVGLAMQTADLGVSSQPLYTNSLLNTRTHRTSGMTDSGNYSNRSSDASLGMQSTTGFLEGKSCSRPSGSHYEDYEDLDVSAQEDSGSEHPPVLYKSENEQYSPKGTTDDSSGAITLQQVKIQYINTTSTGEDLESKVNFVEGACLHHVSPDHDPTKLKQISSDTKRLSHLNDDCSDPYYDMDLAQPINRQTTGCVPDSLSSELDFLSTFRPLQRQIQSVIRHLTECLCTSSHPVKQPQTSPSRLNGSLLARQVVRQFSEDLAYLSKLCRAIVLISKDSPDPGLVRKFCTVQKTLDHTVPQLDRILEELSTSETKSHLEKPQLLSKMERLLKLIAQCMAVLETTVLTNINLLFSPTKLTDPLPQNQPDSKVNAFAHAAVDILSPSTAPPSSWSLNRTEDCSCNNVSYGSQSRLSELVKLIPVERFSELQSQCEHAWSSLQCFLGRVLPAKTGPPSSKTSNNPLTPKTVNTLVSATLDSCTELIKSVSSFCALLSTLVDTFTDKTEILALQNELTTKNDSLCEALKGIITQAKEVSSHLQKEKEGPPLPGPVLQRLIGAGHTVCLCVKSIEACISRYYDRTQTG